MKVLCGGGQKVRFWIVGLPAIALTAARVLEAATTAKFAASVAASLREQQRLEAAETGSFEDFVAQYYA